MDTMMYQEKKGPAGPCKQYIYSDDASAFVPLASDKEGGKVASAKERVHAWLQDVFLPQGYPDSVSSDYLHYQMWDTMQAYCSSIAGALSLQATLTGLGVGEDAATPLAATLMWLIKDGSGMVASIAFAYWRGSQLDCNSKQWRLFADVANDSGHLIRLLGPVLPVPFLAVMCVSAVLMALVGVAGGATRAALTLHQARRGNMADVSAKDGSQETLVNLAALFTSLTILPIITPSFSLVWITFLACVVFHLVANYKAVRATKMETLNRQRLLYVLNNWFNLAAVPGVDETNLAEPLLTGAAFMPNYFIKGFSVAMGCSLQWALTLCKSGKNDIKELYSTSVDAFKHENYMIITNWDQKKIFVIYRKELTPEEELEAFFTTYLGVLNFMHITEHTVLSAEYVVEGLDVKTQDRNFLPLIKQFAKRICPAFLEALKAKAEDGRWLLREKYGPCNGKRCIYKGWNVNKVLLAADEWRVS